MIELNYRKISISEIIEKLKTIKEISKKQKYSLIFKGINGLPFALQDFHSNRGSYSELGIELDSSWGSSYEQSIDEIIKKFEEVIGKDFIGYKGGLYTMNETTEVHIDGYGHTGIAVKDIIYDEENNEFWFLTYLDWEAEKNLKGKE